MEDISKFKVADLKRELKKRGLAITGNKQELVERLEQALQSNSNWVEGGEDEEFDEDEILTDDPKQEAPKSAKKKPVGIKRAAATPSKATPTKAKVAKTVPATNGVAKEKTEVKTDASTAETKDKKLTPMEARAERFGIPLSSSAQIASRAERFGIVSNGASKGVDLDKLKARASRFGEVTSKSLSKLDTLEKKKAREERFQTGTETKESETPSKLSISLSSSGKPLITPPSGVTSAADEAKKKRLERFAA